MIIHKDYPLSQILWYKIGGKVEYLIEVEDVSDIYKAFDFIEKNKIQKVFFCGFGSNLIFTDDYFKGAVVRIVKSKAQNEDFKLKGDQVSVFGGVAFDDLIQFSFANKLTGLEWAGGLPGTVGAGVRGNVGAFGREIEDCIYSVEVVNLEKDSFKPETIYREGLEFSYRNSLVKKDKRKIIISATFQLKREDAKGMEIAKKTYFDNINYRKVHHPLEYPTCGSVFKNIKEEAQIEKIVNIWPDLREFIETKWKGKVSMGYVINRLGFSGYRVGNMQVSTKHANFIVNLGGGKYKDVMAIIEEIKNKVREIFGFFPEVEVEIVGLY